jgi:hypothetical protein
LAHVCVIDLPRGSVRHILLQRMAGRGELGICSESVEPIILRRLFHPDTSNAVQRAVVAAGIGGVARRLRGAATT